MRKKDQMKDGSFKRGRGRPNIPLGEMIKKKRKRKKILLPMVFLKIDFLLKSNGAIDPCN